MKPFLPAAFLAALALGACQRPAPAPVAEAETVAEAPVDPVLAAAVDRVDAGGIGAPNSDPAAAAFASPSEPPVTAPSILLGAPQPVPGETVEAREGPAA